MAFRQFIRQPLEPGLSPSGEQVLVLPESSPDGTKRVLNEFRDDLRPPKMVFGRCNVTGNWGGCVALDLGDISILAPDAVNGVTMSEEGEVLFSQWHPTVFQQQILLSTDGLRKVLSWAEGQDVPIPTIKPFLAYAWQLMYKDGSTLTQFWTDPDTNEERENLTKDIDWSQVNTFQIVSHYPEEKILPVYTFIPDTGKIYKGDEELDLAYDAAYPDNARPFYGRYNHHSTGSVMIRHSLDRTIQLQKSIVLQLLGWRTNSLGDGPSLCCLIAVDETGDWRPWEYIKPSDLEI